MNRFLLALATLGLLLPGAPVAQAQFTFITNGGALTLTGYTGSGGVVAIPAATNGLPVTSIKSNVFFNVATLASVTIPGSVTNIGSMAFASCSGLTNVTMSNGLASIGGGVFSNCAVLAGVTIPASVTHLGSNAFEQCASLASITIPGSVTNIGNDAFSGCAGLTNVTMNSGVLKIGMDAFEQCASLASVTIPGSVTNIGEYAFWECSSLSSVTMGNGVLNIGEYAFWECAHLSSMIIPGSVTNVGEYAFWECGNLSSVTMSNGVLNIGDYAFLDCTNLSSVTIPGSITNIGQYAFNECGNLSSVTMANGVLNIGDYAFWDCTNLSSVTIPGSVTNIGYGAFAYCSSLTYVIVNKGVPSIGDYAFSYCPSLTAVYFKGNAPTADSTVFAINAGYDPATIYYLPGATGWKSTFAGRPTALEITDVVKVQVLPASSDGIVGGAGSYIKGTQATVTASPASGCYAFTGWTAGGKTVSTNSPYIFTVTNNVTLTANFEQFKYTITTASSPAAWGTTSGGGKFGCGTTAKLKAAAKSGFGFVKWTSGGIVQSTNASCSVSVGGNESYTAYFKDIQPPKIGITAPAAKEKVSTAAFVIYGEVSDNVGVSNVHYNLNGGGWTGATLLTQNNTLFWYSYVTLKPNSPNSLSVCAVDASGNVSATNTVAFTCAAPGLAPLSIAGEYSWVEGMSGNIVDYCAGFDRAAYFKLQGETNSDAGEVGTYTYTPTGPNTAELAWQPVLPVENTNVQMELTFTNAYDATFTNPSAASGGIFYFETVEQTTPSSLNGFVAVTASEYGGGNSTNSFAGATFTQESSHGGASGAYTFTPLTPVGALLAEALTNGNTDYLVLLFTNETSSPAAGCYFSEMLGATNQILSGDFGTFTTTSNAVTGKFTGPATLAGLQATVTPSNGISFTRSFGNGTFASISTTNTGPADVGFYLANTRVTTNTGEVSFLALAPPYAVGQDDGAVDVTWKTSSSATLKGVDSDVTGAMTLSKVATNAPASLSGRTITVTPKSGTASVLVFTNNLYTNSAGNSGTYTYAPFTPTMALVTASPTNAGDVGKTGCLLLNFQSLTSGVCVASKQTNQGAWEIKPGAFKIK